MIISHWLYPVHVLGPGSRLVLWVQGCSRRCDGCISPELQSYEGISYDVNDLSDIINNLLTFNHLNGITISGGEPFDQGDDLIKLCSRLSTNDILIYSGYSYQELQNRYNGYLASGKIGVIITNPYIDKLNDNLPLRGSSNQEIIYLNANLKNDYENYLASSIREQQLFIEPNAVYLAGIPPKGSADIIRKEIKNIIKGEKE